ncbi:MAG: nitrogenase [Pelosinus sp.]|nr:nitrogenase [Pelosinus sp.]
MLREIAVLLNKAGQTIKMGEEGKIVVYHQECGVWQICREQSYDISHASLGQIRNNMRELLIFMDGCKVFAAESVTGVYYYELEKAEVNVWEISGKPAEFLDYIIEHEELEADHSDPKPIAVPVPEEIADGRYFVSIKDIQESNTSITSKQVLLPFLQRGTFYSLEILCSHIPPWLENQLLLGRLESEVTKLSNKEVKVVIMKACCS